MFLEAEASTSLARTIDRLYARPGDFAVLPGKNAVYIRDLPDLEKRCPQ